NSSTTDDSPRTDLERIVVSPGVPLRAFSSGTLIRLSTSSVDMPGASVWTSTFGGANSGNTSSGAVRIVRPPWARGRAHRASTSTRPGPEDEISQLSMGSSLDDPGLRAEELLRAGGHALRPRRRPAREDGVGPDRVPDDDPPAREAAWADLLVH